MAGVSRLQYTSEMRLIRVMCSGRVDLGFVLRAFEKGHDGVFIGGCRLNECNYITHGNYDALGMVFLCRKIMEYLGINHERLRIEFMSAADGNLLAEHINDFCGKVKELGPVGKGYGEDLNQRQLESKLGAVIRLVPYIKLVERERFRIPAKSREEYEQFFSGDEFKRLFDELIADKLTLSQIVSLLGESPLSTLEISEILGLNPSEVSGYMNSSSKLGLVRYDENRKSYALA